MTAEERAALDRVMKAALYAAHAGLVKLDESVQADLRDLFEKASADIARVLRAHAGSDGLIPPSALSTVIGLIELRLARLRDEQQKLIEKALQVSAENGAKVIDVLRDAAQKGTFSKEAINSLPDRLASANEVLQTVLNEYWEDGLNLSSRLWRNYGALRQELLPTLQQAIIEGDSARTAARSAVMQSGVATEDQLNQIDLARAGALGETTAKIMGSEEATAYANAQRVFRTEMDRANILATRAGIYSVDGVVGTRFKLHPLHPRFDICDMHANVNLYGLGRGVYPPGTSPLPAHPNTLSYEEAVFAWEIGPEDRINRDDLLGWLARRNDEELYGVLQSGDKVAALRQGLLQPGEITLPWRELKGKYESRLHNT